MGISGIARIRCRRMPGGKSRRGSASVAPASEPAPAVSPLAPKVEVKRSRRGSYSEASKTRRASESQPRPPPEWLASPFSCYQAPAICCFSTCCFPCAFGSITRMVDDSYYCHCILAGLIPCTIPIMAPDRRLKIRDKFHLPEAPCHSDLVFWLCCPCCALIQETRELTERGVFNNEDFVNAVKVTFTPHAAAK